MTAPFAPVKSHAKAGCADIAQVPFGKYWTEQKRRWPWYAFPMSVLLDRITAFIALELVDLRTERENRATFERLVILRATIDFSMAEAANTNDPLSAHHCLIARLFAIAVPWMIRITCHNAHAIFLHLLGVCKVLPRVFHHHCLVSCDCHRHAARQCEQKSEFSHLISDQLFDGF
ncbi:hypothetical protein [Burkholderia stabilis]|uniref:hypothetical protein n=1 Tax=Burkholderia stabilis TaxID=95485 RepID=UPI0015901515|nr:hypothetical protein [Burkholderia stabilis]